MDQTERCFSESGFALSAPSMPLLLSILVLIAHPAVAQQPAPGGVKSQLARQEMAVPLTRIRPRTLKLTPIRAVAASPQKFQNPPEITSQNGSIDIGFTMQMVQGQVYVVDQKTGALQPQAVNLRNYSWKDNHSGSTGAGLTPPTLIVKTGDTIDLHLTNNLPSETSCSEDHPANPTSCLNNTNLHTHGLHISPSDNHDNVLLVVHPCSESGAVKCREDYQFQILPAGNPDPKTPFTHYPGTFWYHPHNHGSTAAQVASAMAGALIIRGDIDEVPGIKGANERIFLLQQLAFDATGQIQNFNDIDCNWSGQQQPWCPDQPGPPKVTTINGLTNPVIDMQPGQVERWRFIEAGYIEMIDLKLGKLEGGQLKPVPFVFHQIAVDGITLKAMVDIPDVGLGPGYRTDVMVQAPDNAGTYILYKDETNNPLRIRMKVAGPPQVTPLEYLAQIVVAAGKPCKQDSTCHWQLPSGPLPHPQSLPDITKAEVQGPPKVVVFSDPNGNTTIDGHSFDPNPNDILPDFQLTLGGVQEWHLQNPSNSGHPFHIHVNAFQLLDDKGNPAEWADTVVIPPCAPQNSDGSCAPNAQPGTVSLRTRYETFTGDFVLHCHILEHEDMGMMLLVEVSAKKGTPKPTAMLTHHANSAEK